MIDGFPEMYMCDSCGCYYSQFEFAETVEEMLCEQCASGMFFDSDHPMYEDDMEFYDGQNSD